MPAKRLPWFKIWVGATRHEKVVTLDDRSFRAWVELLDAASEQPVRGRFTSYAAAAAIIRRPPAMVRRLAEARLIDEREDGVWLHDWPDWQRWTPDEQHANDSGITHEHPPNGTRSTHERLTNDTSTTHELSREDGDGDGDGDEEERRETKKRDESSAPSSPTTTAASENFSQAEQQRIDSVTTVLAEFGLSGSPAFWRKVLDTRGQLDLGAEAFKQADWMRRHRIKACTTARYLNWLDKAQLALPTNSADEPTEPTECNCEQIRASLEINRNSYPYCHVHGRIRLQP